MERSLPAGTIAEVGAVWVAEPPRGDTRVVIPSTILGVVAASWCCRYRRHRTGLCRVYGIVGLPACRSRCDSPEQH